MLSESLTPSFALITSSGNGLRLGNRALTRVKKYDEARHASSDLRRLPGSLWSLERLFGRVMVREHNGCWGMSSRVITWESFETGDLWGYGLDSLFCRIRTMMPPNCCLCGKGLATGDECELICFHKTLEQEAWYAEAEARLIPDHPPNCAWFCEDHAKAARSLVDLDLDRALATVQAGENEVR